VTKKDDVFDLMPSPKALQAVTPAKAGMTENSFSDFL
jgi:hypothetical protein